MPDNIKRLFRFVLLPWQQVLVYTSYKLTEINLNNFLPISTNQKTEYNIFMVNVTYKIYKTIYNS